MSDNRGFSTLGGRIRRQRLVSGLAQYELAKILGVSAPTVSEWESDKKIPARERWSDIAQALSASENDLFQINHAKISTNEMSTILSEESTKTKLKTKEKFDKLSKDDLLDKVASLDITVTYCVMILDKYEKTIMEISKINEMPDSDAVLYARKLCTNVEDKWEWLQALLAGARALIRAAKAEKNNS